MKPPNNYPPGSFYFQLQLGALTTLADNAFEEASGLSVEPGAEEIREGGQPHKHRVQFVDEPATGIIAQNAAATNRLLFAASGAY